MRTELLLWFACGAVMGVGILANAFFLPESPQVAQRLTEGCQWFLIAVLLGAIRPGSGSTTPRRRS